MDRSIHIVAGNVRWAIDGIATSELLYALPNNVPQYPIVSPVKLELE